MNRAQLEVVVSTMIVIGMALLVYVSSRRGEPRVPVWVWFAAAPYLAAIILASLIRGLIVVIGWPIGRLSGQSALLWKWLDRADRIIISGCMLLAAVGTVGGLVWLVLQLITGG